MAIDDSRELVPLNIAILTVSDSRSFETDTSGATLESRATAAGHRVVERRIVPDLRYSIEEQLWRWVESEGVDVVLTTGGTGVTGRDVTTEAVEHVCDKLIPGFGELFRLQGFEKIGTSAIQSRATAGVARGTYLFAIPGSTGACKDAWDGILATQLDSRFRPCNFAELLPRLREHQLDRFEPMSLADVRQAQDAWAKAVVDGDVETLCDLYDYGVLMFKPTMSAAIRTDREGARSYFVGGDPRYPADTGFLLRDWASVEFESARGPRMGGGGIGWRDMGHYLFTDVAGQSTKADYTFGYHKKGGRVLITLHHSSFTVGG